MAYVTKEMAATARQIVNKIGKEYGFKFSVTKKDGSLTVALMSGRALTLNDFEIPNFLKSVFSKYGLETEYKNENIYKVKEFLNGADYGYILSLYNKYWHISKLVNGGSSQYVGYFKGEIKEMFDKIETSIKKALNHYDKSDAMIDYFDTNFYLCLEVGKWNKNYKIIEKKAV